MRAVASRSAISGRVPAPSSKSAMQRYIAGALLADGVSHIHLTSFCDDSFAAIGIAADLGAEVTVTGNEVKVRGGFKPRTVEIFCGESGLSARMFTPIAALHNAEITLNGKGSLLNRQLIMAEDSMASLGVKINSKNGFLPLKISGPMHGGVMTADGSVSSQFITGLLMALPLVAEDSLLIVDNLVSKPYIDLTISILKEFGVIINNEGYRKFIISGQQKYKAGDFNVEGDWSGAAFLMVMGAIGGEVLVEGLGLMSNQADKAILDALVLAGAGVEYHGNIITVNHGNLKGFDFDISDCPDLAPPLAILALSAKGKTVIRGAERLASKESNRGKTLTETLSLLGAKVTYRGNLIEIEGGKMLKGGTADSHNDHRIAMALAAAALLCDSPVVINGMECINKSYPRFIDDYRKIGGKIETR
jgi:3-phosphoshikimate 1-carboxyvinyltransferase